MNTNATNLVVGLGITGLSCVRYFARKNQSCKVVDSRVNPPGLELLRKEFPEVECELGPFNESTFMNAAELIVSPGVSLKNAVVAKAIESGVSVTGDVDIFSREVSEPIVAVTGSNGKSTVVSMVGEVLKAAGRSFAIGGNLDADPALPALDMLSERKDFYVLELSSFQLETTRSLGAEVATILNLSEDHLDRYADMDEYRAAKLRIYTDCKQIVINQDFPVPPAIEEFSGAVWSFGFSESEGSGVHPLTMHGEKWVAFEQEPLFKIDSIKVVGRHNLANAMAATALCLALKIDHQAIREGITSFPGLPHRCQWVANGNGVDYYNDSKGTNVGASIAAIEGLAEKVAGKIVLIAGGEGKGADFSQLVPVLKRCVRHVVLIGTDAPKIAEAIGKECPFVFAADMQGAVTLASELAEPGDAVLLSPACASFDMFDNFRHRGNVFSELVGTTS